MARQRSTSEAILLFDAECSPCSRVAKRLKSLNVQGLDTKSFKDPEVAEVLSEAGHPIPDEPTLLEIDGGSATLCQGIRMRLKLARRIGFRKAGSIVGLLAAERRARTERSEPKGSNITRRRLFGGAAAASAGAVIFGTAQPAAAEEPSPLLSSLSPEETELLRRSDTVSQALRVWGDGGNDRFRSFSGKHGESIATIVHNDPATTTFVSAARPEIGVTLQVDADQRALRYYLASGTPLGELTAVGDELQINELDDAYAPASAEIEPLQAEIIACWLACMTGEADVDCAISCIGCATGSWLDCAACGICAGGAGLSCAYDCL
ncbi:hypothetical protein GCM10029992_04250 [Glycomyces albus]